MRANSFRGSSALRTRDRSMLRLMCLVALLLALVVQPGLAADEPVLLVGTEASADGEVRPSQELVSVVLRAIDRRDIELLDECLSEEGLRQADYASLLRAVRIDAGGGRNLWFVRPALRPYCFALYGAHAFHYFLIEERPSGSSERYRLLFQNRGRFSRGVSPAKPRPERHRSDWMYCQRVSQRTNVFRRTPVPAGPVHLHDMGQRLP